MQVVDGNQSKYNLLYVVELNLEENLFANINFLLIDTHMSTEDIPVVRVNEDTVKMYRFGSTVPSTISNQCGC